MRLVTIHRLSVATAVGALLSLVATGEAGAYTFTKIADTSTTIPNSTGVLQQFGTPAINNGGTVAFWAAIQDNLDRFPWFPNERIFAGSGQSFTYNSGRDDFDSHVFINDKGTIYSKSFRRAQTLPYPSLQYGRIYGLNNRDTHVYEDLYLGYKTINFGRISIDMPMDYPDLFPGTPFSDVDEVAINDQDNVVFLGKLRKGDSGIFVACNGSPFASSPCQNRLIYGSQSDDYDCPEDIRCKIGTLVDSRGLFKYFGNPDINNQDTVAFTASLDAGGGGIFTIKDGKISTIIDTISPFCGGGSLAINDLGTVAFGGGYGICTGSGSVADKVITRGDILFGSPVTYIDFSKDGFNNMGQIAFRATLEDGTQGIYRADPEPPKSVPDPSGVLGLLTVGVLALVKRRKS